MQPHQHLKHQIVFLVCLRGISLVRRGSSIQCKPVQQFQVSERLIPPSLKSQMETSALGPLIEHNLISVLFYPCAPVFSILLKGFVNNLSCFFSYAIVELSHNS